MNKASEEWVIMRYFREKYPYFPKGKLIKSESPDFILRTNRKNSIGIEITRLDYLIGNKPGNVRDQLSKLFEKKELKLRLYKKNLLKEYWLIIIIESGDINEIFEFACQQTFTFDKVILFDMFSGDIKEMA